MNILNYVKTYMTDQPATFRVCKVTIFQLYILAEGYCMLTGNVPRGETSTHSLDILKLAEKFNGVVNFQLKLRHH